VPLDLIIMLCAIPIQFSNKPIRLQCRHCEPTGRANARPMSGSARQSTARATVRMDCFGRFAPRKDGRHTPALPRRNAPELHDPLASENRGRRESRVPAAPAVSRAKLSEAHERSHREVHRIQPGLPCAMVLTASFVLSPVTGLFCHRRLADPWCISTRLGGCISAKLDASVGASGPHDFAVREKHLSSARLRSLTGNPPCHHVRAPNAAASTASRSLRP
jgi:hypothetical protein